jgi:hypothetical protein
VATLIGNTGVIGATLAFGPDGTLYQTSAVFDEAGFVAGYLNTLDPDTGAVLTTIALPEADRFVSARLREETQKTDDEVGGIAATHYSSRSVFGAARARSRLRL